MTALGPSRARKRLLSCDVCEVESRQLPLQQKLEVLARGVGERLPDAKEWREAHKCITRTLKGHFGGSRMPGVT